LFIEFWRFNANQYAMVQFIIDLGIWFRWIRDYLDVECDEFDSVLGQGREVRLKELKRWLMLKLISEFVVLLKNVFDFIRIVKLSWRFHFVLIGL
jgi:hypothetical protein